MNCEFDYEMVQSSQYNSIYKHVKHFASNMRRKTNDSIFTFLAVSTLSNRKTDF